MPYSLKNPPDLYNRPKPPKLSRWMTALAIIAAVSFLLMHFFGGDIEDKPFWWLALGAPAALWLTTGVARLIICLLQNIMANGYDERRERWILSETRKSRRALQVLNVSFITGHPQEDPREVVQALISHQNIIRSQPDWRGENGHRLTRFNTGSDLSADAVIRHVFSHLITDLPVNQFTEDSRLVVAFDLSSSLSEECISDIWKKIWQETNIHCAVEYSICNGLTMIDHWLNHRITQNEMLLVVALQVMPEETDYSAEVAVALLLGNRLKQNILQPLALLHRPELSLPGQLGTGMNMAAYNVPLKNNIISQLWLAGLSEGQHEEMIINQHSNPAGAVENEAIILLDRLTGHAGAAGTWLAIAAAVFAAENTRTPQITITGERTTGIMWSTVITPVDPVQEMDT
ncbi:hypothetical protein GKQ23_14270 [Erwinia sp. E602]|uniref:hypothetical protein n=1 Tax=Erwinia sp. E602 TaxID=2675378 RepID=UPI001BA8D247|nr:hypothetical protein [Erwinia sp. E602]QUG76095.1 hypothetical protein GKQ23_14270 [Erwinia sp. E602]